MQQLKQRTPAQVAAVHTLESSGISTGITLLVAAVQYTSLHGLNWTGLGSTMGVAFVATMSMMYKSLMLNSQIMQGVKDSANQGWQFLLAELKNITAALTGGKPVPTSLPAATSPIAVDVQGLAMALKAELMKPVDQQPTRPSVEAVRTNTPPAQPLPAVQPISAYPPNTGAPATVNWQPPQRPYGG